VFVAVRDRIIPIYWLRGGRCARSRIKNRRDTRINMFSLLSKALCRLLREDYLGAENAGALMWRFTWGKP